MMAESNNLSPLRKWIVAELTKMLPYPMTIWSNSANEKERETFQNWTGAKQGSATEVNSLEWHWKTKKDTFSTCTSFLPVFASRIRSAGRMPLRQTNRFGNTSDVVLQPFKMNAEIGWVSYRGGTPNARVGDFFQLAHGGVADHVGVILEISEGKWSCVAGGAGGPSQGRDGVSRSHLNPIPGGLQGWLDVDAYFQFWAGPGAEEVIYEQPW